MNSTGTRIDTAERQVECDGKPLALTPKALDLLVYFVGNSRKLLAKEELMQAVWQDRFVEESNLTVTVSALRKALGDKPDGQPYIETVPKRGYRFSAAVIERPKGIPAAPSPVRQPRRKPWVLGTVALAAALGLAIFLYFSFRPVPNASITIAVLPFRPLGTSPNDDYLGLGITDALITRLGRVRQVIVRPTSVVRKYSSGEVDPLNTGKSLGVSAVLDGSIQRVRDRIRITARLLRVADGTTLWSQEFDENFTDMLSTEDSISQTLTRALALKLTGGEMRELTRHDTSNSEAYQSYLKGRFFWSKRNAEAVGKGIEQFEQAIRLDRR